MGKLIAVIGNTAAGKTTLVKALSVAAPFVTGLEQHAERPFQQALADDLKAGGAQRLRYALANQIDYLLLRAEQEQTIRRQPGVGLVDGGLDEDFFVFSRHFHALGYLSTNEQALCERFYRYVRSVQPPPDLFIYLTAPLEVLRARFLHRRRTVEIATAAHLAQLQDQVDDWVATIERAHLLVVDATQDFTSPAALTKLLTELGQRRLLPNQAHRDENAAPIAT
ncbi:MAG TPA: deoxynucleoside kinase [Chloroflexi bacterium]|nr:deoxynucleoside kinase [Chloroflexota bacterium]